MANKITDNKEKFKEGDYATDGRDFYYILGVEDHEKDGQRLEVENIVSGNSYDLCEFRFYKKISKTAAKAAAWKLKRITISD